MSILNRRGSRVEMKVRVRRAEPVLGDRDRFEDDVVAGHEGGLLTSQVAQPDTAD
jgi:hypothetical protein